MPFTSISLGQTTFQITTSIGRSLHTYDLRRGLNLVFLTRPQTPATITATSAWKDKVFAAWGGGSRSPLTGVWVFKRGKRVAELDVPTNSTESIKQLIIFGSWIVGCCSTRVEIWKTSSYEHYTTLFPSENSPFDGARGLSGVLCNMPTYLNKILVGKNDGSVEIWNISVG